MSEYADTSVTFDDRNSTGPYGTAESCLYDVRADLGWTATAEEVVALATWLDDTLGHDWAREMAEELLNQLEAANKGARWHFAFIDPMASP